MNHLATNILDFVNTLSRLNKNHNIDRTLERGTIRELWCWWIEALEHEEAAKRKFERRMASAMVEKLTLALARRGGPKSVEIPKGWEEPNEEPETRTGDAQLPLEVGGGLD